MSDLPEFLTVEEAARLLRIGRTTAYALAKAYRSSGEGLPVVVVGRLLRVPTARLVEWTQRQPAQAIGMTVTGSGSTTASRGYCADVRTAEPATAA